MADRPTMSTKPSTHLCPSRIPRERLVKCDCSANMFLTSEKPSIACAIHSCVIESIPRRRSYPSSSPSTTRACTATGGLSSMLMWTTVSPQHTSEPPPTVNTGSFFVSHALQHALHTRVWVHLVSTCAECLHPLMRTLTAGSTLFSSDFGGRLALRLPPLARFPDNFALCGVAAHSCPCSLVRCVLCTAPASAVP